VSGKKLLSSDVKLDDFGRVVLDDQMIDALLQSDLHLSLAGGVNTGCSNNGCNDPTQVNQGCTNTGCGPVNNMRCENRVLEY
jgi:hypothetical protein